MAKTKLVIVESPTKIKTISKYLPRGYKVASCVGHIRDLPGSKKEVPKSIKGEPWADYAIDVDHDFEPHYVVIPGKGKVIADLKKKLEESDELYLATDEDREGESIAWHLVESLRPKVPVKRLVFNEITREAIEAALEHPRGLDMDLVQAQETRRILDRLYGYSLSPLLWKKIGGNLSAGRVQSVALRIIVIRERERRAFRAGGYWDLTALLDQRGSGFEATMVALEGKRLATGKDFDEHTGHIAEGKDVVLLDEAAARALQERLKDKTWTVTSVEAKERQSSPPPPFITSTLQQEANYRLNLSARDTMRVAQGLYEGGYITYMRTDSTTLSDEGIRAARAAVKDSFGDAYLPSSPRTYEHKTSAAAQEAHEAIRPAGTRFVHPDESGLTGRELALYRLIWQRTVACQMVNERYTSTSVGIQVEDAQFVATGKIVDFPGYRKVYESRFEEDKEKRLPPLAVGDTPRCVRLDAEGHETKPPARYTEATLVKALEEQGIGRPSTYADILAKIESKRYVVFKGRYLVPTLTAFAVIGLLEKHFPRLVDLEFTATMEETLDEIAAGSTPWLPYLKEFFHGPDGLKTMVDERLKSIEPSEARVVELEGMPMSVRIGRFGPYVETEIDGERVSASIPESATPDELTEDYVRELIRQKKEGPTPMGTDPATGKKVYLLTGRFGPYFQLGEVEDGADKPRRASLPRNMKPDQATLDDALFYLSFPKELGPHPGGGRVIAGLGRFGPFVAHDPGGGAKMEYRNVASPEDLRAMALDKALVLLAQPKGSRKGGRGAAKVLKDLGKHPADGAAVQVLDGRYGPYVKHAKTNATLPRGTDPASVTLEQAVRLLEERQARGPAKRGRRRASS